MTVPRGFAGAFGPIAGALGTLAGFSAGAFAADGAMGVRAMAGGTLCRTVLALQGAERNAPLPGPGPWGARQWVGAAVYVGVFMLALWGMSRLARGAAPDGDGPEGGGSVPDGSGNADAIASESPTSADSGAEPAPSRDA